MSERPIAIPLVLLIIIIVIADYFLPVIILRNHYTKHLQEAVSFKYLIVDSPKQTEKTYSYIAKIVAYKDKSSQQWQKTCGKIKIYIPKNIVSTNENKLLNYGDVIISSDNLSPIRNFDGKNSFDYVRYMRHKRIYHQVFMRNFDIEQRNQGNILIRVAKNINQSLQDRIKLTSMGEKQKNVATALLLGDKKDIDSEIRRQFNTSGLAHILCVSGLHIMLIISALSFLLKFLLPKNLTMLYVRNIILVLASYLIAFVVGLTPSALRVAFMLTLLIMSKFTPLNDDKLNILLVTAFVFICFDPLIIFNISFELSFLAVFGILTVKPYLFSKLSINRNKRLSILNGIINNMTTTFSAQIFCMPVIIANFSRFPVLFLFSNLVIIPFMQIILLSVILLVIFANVPVINGILSFVCNYGIEFLIQTARLTDLLTP